MNGDQWFYLGVDTGSTKSHALIVDGNGRIAGFAAGGPGNWEGIGWDGTRAVLTDIIHHAASQAGIGVNEIAGAGFGLAGYDWPEDRQPHVDIIREIGVSCPIQLFNDGFIALPAGTDAGWGVVVSAGTSCNSYGCSPDGKLGRSTGSSRFGEYAGAGELVVKALQAVAHDWAKRGPATQLTAVFCELVGATDAEDLLAGLMRRRYQIGAGYALVVFEVAAAGDEVAQNLICWAGDELGKLANGIIRQIGIADLAFEVVLSGSFFKGSPVVQDKMLARIHTLAPQAKLVWLNTHPVVGAALMGAEADGVKTAVLRPTLLENMATLAEILDEEE